MNDIQTIINHYMNNLDDPKVLAELRDILYNHFDTVKNSSHEVDQEYFQVELKLANKE